jgi:hypothetical protein
VKDLFLLRSTSWNAELIKNLFNEEDVKCIMAIPTHGEYQDTPAWHFGKKGDLLYQIGLQSAYQ